LDDIVSHFRLYSRQQNRLVEIGADRPADILEWLTTGTGVGFRIPDLTDSGLAFVGARLVTAENTPTGVLFYRRTTGDNEGDILALTFSRARPETTKPIEDIRLDTSLVSWSTPLATYVIVAPSSAADLDEIAAKAAGLI
jgi:anti-sigma factor RsiW